MGNKALNLVYRTHNEGKEKTAFLTDFILRHDKSNFYEDIYDSLVFFYKHIPVHFIYEEVLINALLDSRSLNAEEISSMERILEEHKKLKNSFEKIKETAAKMETCKTSELKECFMDLVNDTIFALIKHAEYEDERLYPIIEAKAGESVLTAVEKEMSKIVS